MKVIIDRKHCVGHGMCNMYSPDVFKLDEDGYAYVEGGEVPAELQDSARLGASACPERAIRIEE